MDEPRLWALMRAADVHVSLRSPTMGETSGTAIRALALGKPLVVSDVGWFAELPDEVALKVPVDDHEEDTLTAALELLAARADVRASMGAAALELALREHDLGSCGRPVRLGVRAGGRRSSGRRRRARRRLRGCGGRRHRARLARRA